MSYASSWPGLVCRRISASGIQGGGSGHLWPSKPHRIFKYCFLLHFTLCLSSHSSLFWKLFTACVCAPFYYAGTLGTDSWLKDKQEIHCSAHVSAPFNLFSCHPMHTPYFSLLMWHFKSVAINFSISSGRERLISSMVTSPGLHPMCPRSNILWKHWPYPAHMVGHRHCLLAYSPSCCLDLKNSQGKKGGKNKLLLFSQNLLGPEWEAGVYEQSMFT